MEFYAIHIPKTSNEESEGYVFEEKKQALELLKQHKEARFKAFKSEDEAYEFSRYGLQASNVYGLKSPSSLPIAAEKSIFRAPKEQEIVQFRKSIEANNLHEVYTTVMDNPRFLVSCGGTPAILKQGPRYNALHVAVIAKHVNMVRLLLSTIEKPQFIRVLNGILEQNDQMSQEACSILLESYLNTPDKSLGDTPLHFAAKLGLPDIVEVLISYPQCKMRPNKEGKFPKDIICARCPSTSTELVKRIESLLEERFYVPVLRAIDHSLPPLVGEPFSNSNPPNLAGDPLSPKLEIQAYAGPMDKEQAQVFRKRWKTPPRLVAARLASISPQDSPIPMQSPNMSPAKVRQNVMNNNISSTPVSRRGRRLFSGHDNEQEEVAVAAATEEEEKAMDQKNGNFSFHEENGETGNDDGNETPVMQESMEEREAPLTAKYRPLDKIFNEYRQRDQSPADSEADLERSIATNKSYSFYCEETSSFYGSENLITSPPLKERFVRLADPEKGLEIVGRELAHSQNIGWKEHWKFLGTFADLSGADGLAQLEQFLKNKMKISDYQKNNKTTSGSGKDDSLAGLLSGFNAFNLNDGTPRAKPGPLKLLADFAAPDLPSPSLQLSSMAPVENPNWSVEKALQVYARRTATTLLQGGAETGTRETSSGYTVVQEELKKLHTILCSYRDDRRFSSVRFRRCHSRYAHLIRWYVAAEGDCAAIDRLAGFELSNVRMSMHGEVKCVLEFLRDAGKMNDPTTLKDDKDCLAAWERETECECPYLDYHKLDGKGRAKRKPTRARNVPNLESIINSDMWKVRDAKEENLDDSDVTIEEFFSCESDYDSDSDDIFVTPPESPIFFEVDDSPEDFFEPKTESISFSNYIEGAEPTKTDVDVLNALFNVAVDAIAYPNVFMWKSAMLRFTQSQREAFPSPVVAPSSPSLKNAFSKSRATSKTK